MKISTFVVLVFMTNIFSLTAQVDESAYFAYLHEASSRHDADMNDFVIEECHRFLQTFPSAAVADEVYFILASTYNANKDYERAFCNFLKLKLLYPASARTSDAVVLINDILNDKSARTFAAQKTVITDLVNSSPAQSDKMESHYQYLKFLYDLKLEDLNEILLDEINNYLHTFPRLAKNSDQLFFWSAELYEQDKEWKKAIYTYTKIRHLAPDSPLIPDVLFRKAYILYKEEDEFIPARDTFISVLTDYPQTDIAGDAQFYLAELYQEKLENAEEAINNYRLVTETYPQNPFAVEALKRVAAIYDDEEKYQNAVETYYQIFELYPDDPYTPLALLEIKSIYIKQMKDYEKAIQILKLFATQYAAHEDAAEYLFEAAEIYEEELGEKKLAIDTYHEVRNKFPESRYAEKALDRINELSGQ